ncbi:MAG: 26S proteasome complex subunit [Vezdaea acicularis]|nr:MAG: 26S proteasome complex subunit [Vezdaea acicularis]
MASNTIQSTKEPTKGEKADKPIDQPKPAAVLEEDDEFEDFPVEDWSKEETEVQGDNGHLWEESWDDDDTSDDFSQQLKEELKRVKADKQG